MINDCRLLQADSPVQAISVAGVNFKLRVEWFVLHHSSSRWIGQSQSAVRGVLADGLAGGFT